MENDGMSLVLGGGAIGALCTLGAAWIKARYARTKVEPTAPDRKPAFPVELADKYVTCDQCKAHREHIEKRIDTQTQMFAKVSDKLDMIEEHNEDRAKRMHDRLDPVIRQAAATGEAMKQHLEDHRAERSARQ